MRQTFRIVGIVLATLVVLWVLAFFTQKALGLTTTTKQTYTPDRGKVYGCGVGRVTITWSSFLGDLFKTEWSQYYCFKGGKVYNVSSLHTAGWTTGLGQDLNWTMEQNGGDRHGFYGPGHHWHKSTANVLWKTCTPIPTGCVPSNSVELDGVFVVHSDGSIKFWRR